MQQLVSENAYLREENADLRRQVYSLRVSYGGGRDPGSAGPLPPPPADQPKTTTGIWPEVKTEAAPYGVYSAPGSAMVSSPRIPGSSHARTQSHPGEFVRVSCDHQHTAPVVASFRAGLSPPQTRTKPTRQLTWQDPAAEPSSASSSYPPPLYQFGSVVGDDFRGADPSRHQPPRGSSSSSSRGRLMSSSSVRD